MRLSSFLVAAVCAACATDPSNDAELPSLDEVFADRATFENLMGTLGSASGSGFAGTYVGMAGSFSFSDDCTVDFVRHYDWFVNDAASDAELENVLQAGYEAQVADVALSQTGGAVNLQGDVSLEGVPAIRGPINRDGRFMAVGGVYETETTHFGVAFLGRIDGDDLAGDVLWRLVRLEDPVMPGRCDFTARVTGTR